MTETPRVTQKENCSDYQVINFLSLQESCSQVRNVVQIINVMSPHTLCSQVENIQRHLTSMRYIAGEIIGKNDREIKEFPYISWEYVQVIFGCSQQVTNIYKVRQTVQAVESELQTFFSKRVEILEKEYHEKKIRPSQLVKALLLLLDMGNNSEIRVHHSKAYALLTEVLSRGGAYEDVIVS